MRIPIETIDPDELKRAYPVVNALINIRPSYKAILNKLVADNSVVKIRCYMAVILEMEGAEFCRYMVLKAIDKESDEGKLSKLNYVLKRLNIEYPVKDEDEK